MIQDLETKFLITPRKVTAGGVTGATWVDLQGLDTEHGIKALFSAGAGITAGTCGGYIQASDSSTGADPTTVLTFGTLPATGGSQETHFVMQKRYVRFVGTCQTGSDMIVAVQLLARARYRP